MAFSLENISPERRLLITLKVMESLDQWGLSGEQILAVLDFPEGHRSRHLQKYRKDTPLPDIEANEIPLEETIVVGLQQDNLFCSIKMM